ncbi:hypothetical protein M431DRAFT_274100 [Trichoderma harzianum CBS 226.95]|uniref:Uncharacterized protein n=1 Tax=Trichoderma harzianum CBS 226.95 TaxID=983964 RepID=A0A2T3ZXB4_TRIHA|nr:hypothetical protein M431DRAFT_274100 [Trichoderma harzianum CBS 226.95]PTB49451.1 hypothetical protein M431DRAFT_274100 [Trichoderma harzianum CBS 226.95]
MSNCKRSSEKDFAQGGSFCMWPTTSCRIQIVAREKHFSSALLSWRCCIGSWSWFGPIAALCIVQSGAYASRRELRPCCDASTAAAFKPQATPASSLELS